MSIFFRAAAGKKNSGPHDFFWQLAKHHAQVAGCGQAKIGRRQLALIQTALVRCSAFDQNPGGFGPASFDAEDFFAAVHCRSFGCLYHASWPKTRLKPQVASGSSGAKSKSTTAVLMRKRLRQSEIAS